MSSAEWSKMKAISRRELLRKGPRVLGELLLSGVVGPEERRWYELVQDRNDPSRWHVNLFAGPALGDIARANHLGYRAVETDDIFQLKGQLPHPARLQFRDGRNDSDF